MSNFGKRVSILTMAGIVSLFACGISYAAEGENSLTGFFRKLFNYPVKATEKTGEMTANTLTNTGEGLSQAGENTAGLVQGDLNKGGELVAESTQNTLETAGQTTAETVQIPVQAAEANQ